MSQKRLNLATGGLRATARQGKSAFQTSVLTPVVIAGLNKMLQLLKKAADSQTLMGRKCYRFSLSGKGVIRVKNLFCFYTAACLLTTMAWQYPWGDKKTDLKQRKAATCELLLLHKDFASLIIIIRLLLHLWLKNIICETWRDEANGVLSKQSRSSGSAVWLVWYLLSDNTSIAPLNCLLDCVSIRKRLILSPQPCSVFYTPTAVGHLLRQKILHK